MNIGFGEKELANSLEKSNDMCFRAVTKNLESTESFQIPVTTVSLPHPALHPKSVSSIINIVDSWANIGWYTVIN